MINKGEIFQIGIGTWKVNGENYNDINALIHSYNCKQNYISLYMLYDNGNVVRGIKKFIDQINRQNLFINVNLEPIIKDKKDVEKQLNKYLKILNINYVDCLQLHSPIFSEIPLVDVYKEIERMVQIGKVKYIGISNVNLNQLMEISSAVRIDFFEGVYNLECKLYEDIGVLDYCRKNDIQFMCYQPLRRNRTAMKNYLPLLSLAEKYQKTQNQIILNWIIYEKHIIPLVKCTNIKRIDENIASLNFQMNAEDYGELNKFRNEEFDKIEIAWDGNGVTIDQLANQIE